jgi:hypothetical protein
MSCDGNLDRRSAPPRRRVRRPRRSRQTGTTTVHLPVVYLASTVESQPQIGHAPGLGRLPALRQSWRAAKRHASASQPLEHSSSAARRRASCTARIVQAALCCQSERMTYPARRATAGRSPRSAPFGGISSRILHPHRTKVALCAFSLTSLLTQRDAEIVA